jgi:hypothetical protein
MSNQAARLERGALETETRQICDAFVTGDLKLEDGKVLTPHRISLEILKRRAANLAEGEEASRAPSPGAITENLQRWKLIGFADIGEKPTRFLDYTEDGKTKGLAALKAEFSEQLKDKKAASKAAEKGEPESEPAAPAAPATNTDDGFYDPALDVDVTREEPATPPTPAGYEPVESAGGMAGLADSPVSVPEPTYPTDEQLAAAAPDNQPDPF